MYVVCNVYICGVYVAWYVRGVYVAWCARGVYVTYLFLAPVEQYHVLYDTVEERGEDEDEEIL